jgi:hypothetical protein
MNPRSYFPLILIVAFCGKLFAAGNAGFVKTENFDRDPQWEGFNNRVTPKRVPMVDQDFGYSSGNIAGKGKGEIGGKIWRSSTRASYGANISPKTLAENLSASGTFAITQTSGSSGVFFGWFNAEKTGDNRRDTLGFRFAGEGSGARLTLQLVTDKNQSCGTKVTPWMVDKSKPRGEGRKYRPTSIQNDGTKYTWNLNYDPTGANGDGEMSFTIHSNSSKPDEEFENKTFKVALPKGYREHGTTFDRFGLMNCERGGNPMTIYFDDLNVEGKTEDFSKDPNWTGTNNHLKFEDREQGGAHDFGFSAESNHAGGKPGEIGGTIWRSGSYGYYADHVGSLTLTNRLEARGKIILKAGPPDSGMYLGWFNSAETKESPPQTGNFLGVKIGGPTRVGHYFSPAYATAQKNKIPFDPERQHPKRISVEPDKGRFSSRKNSSNGNWFTIPTATKEKA